MDQALSPQEADKFIAHLRPLVESGTGERHGTRIPDLCQELRNMVIIGACASRAVR